MTPNPDNQLIVESIRAMAESAAYYVKQMERAADNLETTGNLDYASEAFVAVANLNANLRMDRVVSRLIKLNQAHA